MTNTTRTKVSKTLPAIKAILAEIEATGAKVKTRNITIVEAREYTFTRHIDDACEVYTLDLATARLGATQRPRYGGPSVVTPVTAEQGVIVHYRKGYGPESIMIVIPRLLDESEEMVALDDALANPHKSHAAKGAAASRCAEIIRDAACRFRSAGGTLALAVLAETALRARAEIMRKVAAKAEESDDLLQVGRWSVDGVLVEARTMADAQRAAGVYTSEDR